MTSPPDAGTPARASDIVRLFVVLAVLLAGADFATARWVIPASRIERRTDTELQQARALQGPNTLLIVGNSLLKFAMSDTQASQLAPSRWSTQRLVIEQTAYLDWKYGLRELWRSGSRPAVVAVMLPPNGLVGLETRTDYAAFRMVGARDVIPFGREARMHPTEISRLVLSHFSSYYGFRSESRKVLLGRMIPGIDRLLKLMSGGKAPPSDTLETRRLAVERLRELRQVAADGGARVIVLLPPLLGDAGNMRAVVRAAADAGVDVITPGVTGPYVPSDFVDGYHLSPRGSARYMEELGAALRPLLDKP